MHPLTTRPRGYLLLEAIIAGAIAAAGLGGAIVAIGSVRTEVTRNARQATATALVSGALEAQRARGFDALVDASGRPQRVEGLQGLYQQEIEVVRGNERVGAAVLEFAEVRVAVRCEGGGCAAQASTRIYR